MTEKELLYVKDALEHEQFLKGLSLQASAKLKDSELSNYMKQLEAVHTDTFNKFCNLLKN